MTEKIREKIALLALAIEKVDEATQKVIHLRHNFEVVRRSSEKIHERDPRTNQIRVLTPDMLQQRIKGAEQEADEAKAVLLYLTGRETMEEARAAYLNLLTAYHRWGTLREMVRQIDLGATLKEVTETFASEEEVYHAYDDAIDVMKETDGLLEVPELTNLTLIVG